MSSDMYLASITEHRWIRCFSCPFWVANHVWVPVIVYYGNTVETSKMRQNKFLFLSSLSFTVRTKSVLQGDSIFFGRSDTYPTLLQLPAKGRVRFIFHEIRNFWSYCPHKMDLSIYSRNRVFRNIRKVSSFCTKNDSEHEVSPATTPHTTRIYIWDQSETKIIMLVGNYRQLYLCPHKTAYFVRTDARSGTCE